MFVSFFHLYLEVLFFLRPRNPILGNGFTTLKKALPIRATTFLPCKPHSRFGRLLFIPANRLPNSGTDFSFLKFACPIWAPILHAEKVFSRLGKRIFIFFEKKSKKMLDFKK